ncbi:MAG: T9SS type A sorting domain-containing protein, partial [Flavobacterium sp.]|nr:T9SS type A sorting domain-containing protein [Pedobacter sp.]
LSNWQNSWDGITYFSSNMLPSSVALKIEIAAIHSITSMPAITLSNSTVLDVSGSLDCGLNQITGTGSFNLNSGATLITSHASGLSGSVLVSGTKTFSSLANYEFKGASTGTFLTTPTALTVNNLTINYAPGVNLSSSITVNGALNLPGGSFNIGSNILTINGAVTGAGSTTGLTGSANSDLVIGGSGDLNLGFNQTSSPSRSIKNYTQSRNAIVTLSNNMELNELMNLTGSSAKFASNGYLTLISTATKNANIGQLLNGADVTGNVNVQLYITGVTRSARYISTPINDNDASLTKKTFAQIKDYVIITGPQGGVGFDAGGKVQPYAITLALYNEKAEAKKPSYVSVSNIAQLINPGIGFSMFFRGNRSSYSAKVNAPFATPESVTLSLNGPINKFSKSVTLTNTNNPLDLYNGYNLVGNPYPSTIDFHQIPKTVISDQFITVKPNGTQASYKEAGAVGNNGGTRYVQPGQAFYLITGQSSAVLTFVEAFKSTQTLSNGFLSAPKETLSMSNNRVLNKNIIPGIIRINLQDAENTDETTIVFKQDESANADSQDVLFLSGSTVSLSSLSDDDKKMAINMMPELKNINEVRLNVNSSSSGLLKLNFTDLSSTDGYQVFLKDALFSDTLQDVKKLPSYKFMVDKTSSATFGMNRLSVIFKPEPIEPPKLFTAEKIKSGVELRWVAEKAKEIEYFEIEISTDSILFRKAGLISNASLTMNVEYSFVDKSPVSGKNYYRVKQVNRNGKFIYTSIKSVNLLAGNNFKIVIYPNPAKDHIQIQLANRPIGSIDAYIYSISGKKLNKINFATNENLNVNLAGLNPGLYLIELQEAGAKKVVGRAKFTVGL